LTPAAREGERNQTSRGREKAKKKQTRRGKGELVEATEVPPTFDNDRGQPLKSTVESFSHNEEEKGAI